MCYSRRGGYKNKTHYNQIYAGNIFRVLLSVNAERFPISLTVRYYYFYMLLITSIEGEVTVLITYLFFINIAIMKRL